MPKPDAGVGVTPAPNPYGSVGEGLEIGDRPVASPLPNGERLPGVMGTRGKLNAGNGVAGQNCGPDPKNGSAMCISFGIGLELEAGSTCD